MRGSTETSSQAALAAEGKRTPALWAALLAACALALLLASPAAASFEVVKEIAHAGDGVAATPGNLAVDDSSGEVYAVDRGGNTGPSVLGFSGQGQFNLKIGYDVVAHGPDDSANHEVVELAVKATGGTFSLGFKGAQTPSMPFNVSAGELEAKLNALSTIGGAGGSVTVSGGPGDETGSSPYVIAFGGNLGGDYFGPGPEAVLGASSALSGGAGGPALTVTVTAYGGAPEVCRPTAGDVCQSAIRDLSGEELRPGISQEGHGAFATPAAIAVDQATGNVYVVDSDHHSSVVQVFAPSGEYLGGFGNLASNSSELVSESPNDVHQVRSNSIAVDPASGDVYLLDTPAHLVQQQEEMRAMVFKPTHPGDYTEYEYAGPSHDLFAGTYAKGATQGLYVDSQGDIYLAQESEIFEFDASQLGEYEFGQPLAPPTHAFNATSSKFLVEAMTIDPQSGRVIFYSGKGNEYHELNADLEPVSGGEFKPPPGQHVAPLGMAFNPNLSWPTGRPAGVLYLSLTTTNGKESFPARVLALAEAEVFPPAIESELVTSIGISTATLQAEINPRGFQTTYRFQYGDEGPCSEDPCAEAPLGGASAGAANEARPLSVPLTGLLPGTTYHFRVVAAHQFGSTAEGEDKTFTTYPAIGPELADNRAYELVSPVRKGSGEVFPLEVQNGSCNPACEPGFNRGTEPNQAAADGDSVAFQASPLSPSAGFPLEDEYLSTRTSTGWRTVALTPEATPEAQVLSGEGFVSFSPDLSHGVFQGQAGGAALALGAVPGDLYLRDAAGSLRALLTEPPPNVGEKLFTQFAGSSADYSRVFFVANDALTAATPYAPPAPTLVAGGAPGLGENDLYEWDEGELRLVNVAPGNATALPGAAFGSGAALSGPLNYSHAVSADGSRAFFTDEHSGKLYVREDGETTLEVPDPGRCLRSLPLAERVCFLTASTDGSKVLLSDGHVYDVEELGEPPLDLTQGQGGFQGILSPDESLSAIYFVDTAKLTGEEENEYGAKAEAGKDNLYAYREGATTYIATLLPGDNHIGSVHGDWTAPPVTRLAQLSANGRWLAFMSSGRLTSYDNRRADGKACVVENGDTGSPSCFEVYLYDTASGRLACASCNPTGVPPSAKSSNLPSLGYGSQQIPTFVTHFLTDSGRVYFDSFESLSPNDVNGGIEDVYEYEPKGVGSCESEAENGGCVSLVSSGHGAYDAGFFSADEGGANVFFTTRDRLLPADKDEQVDLYDAREGGGIASEAALPGSECQGEACQPPPIVPNESTPASLTFQGAGNLHEGPPPSARCPRHKVKRRGKCVARHARRHREHGHRHKHHGKRNHKRTRARAANRDRRAHR